jgi:uncharacterized protein (UPF0335 family)|tara:strand:+ start:72 stop:365 length:294 start_codon:yes stop_codon:yes gene_type:complete
MLTNAIQMGENFNVDVITTDNRGLTPEEVTSLCLDKIISVSDTAPPAIRDQAQAFRSHLELVILEYMKQAIQHDRITIYNAIKDAGYDKLAEHIRRI